MRFTPLPPTYSGLAFCNVFDFRTSRWVVTQQLPLPVPCHLKGCIGGLTEEWCAIKDFRDWTWSCILTVTDVEMLRVHTNNGICCEVRLNVPGFARESVDRPAIAALLAFLLGSAFPANTPLVQGLG